MGLDMYLEAKFHLSPCDDALAQSRKVIGDAIGYRPPTDKPHGVTELMEVSAVSVRVGYWRKFHPLHNWFVNNVQGRNDDCRPAYVSPETLEELEEILDQVEEDPASASEYFTNDVDEQLDKDDVDYTLKIVIQARKLQAQGWDIHYRSSW